MNLPGPVTAELAGRDKMRLPKPCHQNPSHLKNRYSAELKLRWVS